MGAVFARCAVRAGRVDRSEGPVAGNTRGQVLIGDERTVKIISSFQPDTSPEQKHGDHPPRVGGFAGNRHVRRPSRYLSQIHRSLGLGRRDRRVAGCYRGQSSGQPTEPLGTRPTIVSGPSTEIQTIR